MADVFISYRRQDGAHLAYIIKDRLEDEGISVFLDVTGLTTAGPFPPKLGKAIAEARVFVCLLGPDTLKSEWVRKEIEQACNLGLTLIPVFQPGFRAPDDAQDQSVRDLLRGQGVEMPTTNTLLGRTLDDLVQLVRSALPPAPAPPQKSWWRVGIGSAIGLVIGLILGGLIVSGLDRNGDGEPEPTPPPPADNWTTNLDDGERVAQAVTFIAENPGALAGDLWVFVISPNGRAYPQSEDACHGASITGSGGKWEIRIGLGLADSAGEKFDVVLAVANTPDDSQYIAYKLMGWCAEGSFPGFAALPEEVTEVHRVRGLVRTEEPWSEPPQLPLAPPGAQVTITSPAEGDPVGAEMPVSGTYTNVEDDIWVLVVPSHGRWYPQSEFPCEATHVIRGNGQWQAPKVTIGDEPGHPFDIVVVSASEEASAFFDSRLKLWCKASYYPGLRTIDLPPGLHEQDRIRVYRE